MSQIALPLAWPTAGDREFIVSAANQAAVRHLEHPALWPVMASILVGPPRSGRSLLAMLFAARRGATVIDEANRASEEGLFHAWNAAQAERRPLLIVADNRPPEWRIALPDLASRLAATPAVAISEPDDPLVAGLLAKLLAARGLAATPELLRWLLPRIPRSYRAIEQIVDQLDAASLSERRRLTVPFARSVLGAVIDLSHENG